MLEQQTVLEYPWHNMALVSLSASLFSVTAHNPGPVSSPDSVFSDQVMPARRLALLPTTQPLCLKSALLSLMHLMSIYPTLSLRNFLGNSVCGIALKTRVLKVTEDRSLSVMWKTWFWATAASGVELCARHDCGLGCLLAYN